MLVEIEIEMNSCKNTPENKNKAIFSIKGLYRLNYKNIISFNNEELGITLCEQTFRVFFLPNQLKFFHVASDSTRKKKPCLAFFGQF